MQSDFTRRDWFVACGLSLLIAGCGGSDASRDAASTDNGTGAAVGSPVAVGSRGTIGCSLLTGENPFFQIIGNHITEEAARHGYSTTVLFADNDVTRQSAQMRDFITSGVAAIVISPCETKAIVPVVQEANAKGIPVFTVDIPCREEGAVFVCQISTDNEQGGRQAAEAMIEALSPQGGRVAILHFEQAESCRLRVKGFRDVIESHNAQGRAAIEIVAVLEGGGDRPRGRSATQDLLQREPQLAGIFAINDPSALGAVAALEAAGRTEIVVIGFDGQLEAKRAIRDGRIYADPIQYPDRMGIEVVRQLVAYSSGEEVPEEILIPTTLYTRAEAEQDSDLD